MISNGWKFRKLKRSIIHTTETQTEPEPVMATESGLTTLEFRSGGLNDRQVVTSHT